MSGVTGESLIIKNVIKKEEEKKNLYMWINR